ncbi:MAG: hypothetical protein ACRC1N_12970 [Aeromonas sobria]
MNKALLAAVWSVGLLGGISAWSVQAADGIKTQQGCGVLMYGNR